MIEAESENDIECYESEEEGEDYSEDESEDGNEDENIILSNNLTTEVLFKVTIFLYKIPLVYLFFFAVS